MRIYTAQEHALIGSSSIKKYLEKPHTPLCVIDGDLTVERCNYLREKARERGENIDGALTVYYNGKVGLGVITLEPLVVNKDSENYGCSVRDPVLVRVIRFHEESTKKIFLLLEKDLSLC